MARKRHSAEEIGNKLRQADVELAKGSTVAGVCKLLVISEPTYYAWRREYGGLKVDQAERFKELEQENMRLNRCWPKRSWTTRSCARRPAPNF